MSAQGVQVKAFGLKFGGLKLEKEIVLGGMGCLGGALIFDQDSSAKEYSQVENKVKEEKSTVNQAKQKMKRWSTLGKVGSKRQGSPDAISPTTSSSTAVEYKGSTSATSKKLEISGLEIIGGDSVKGIKGKADVIIENPAVSPSLTVEPGELRFVLCVVDP